MANDTFKQAGAIILAAKADLIELLSSPEHGAIQLTVTHALDQMINRFHFLGGSVPITTPTEQFPPITNFMGEQIAREEVKKEDIIPADIEKNIFIDKVEALYDVFPQMDADKILLNNTIPEDVMVLRGVAKRAGVKNAHNKSLTVQFIEEIKAAIAQKQADAEEKEKFEAELAAKNKTLPEGQMSANQAAAAALNDAQPE